MAAPLAKDLIPPTSSVRSRDDGRAPASMGFAGHAEPEEPISDHALMHRVFGLLERVAHLDGAGVIAFHDGGLRHGDVVISHGRICLVVGPGVPDLEELAHDVEPDLLPLIGPAVRRAKEADKRLGEALLELGRDQEDRVRSLFLYQCARGIIALAETHLHAELELYSVATDAALDWGMSLTPARADYDPRLSFAPIQVYLAAAAMLDRSHPDRACQLFEELGPQSDLAVLLRVHPEDETLSLPVALFGQGPTSLGELRRLSYALYCLSRVHMLVPTGGRAEIFAFGRSWNDFIVVEDGEHVVLLHNASVGAKARAASRVFDLKDTVQRPGAAVR